MGLTIQPNQPIIFNVPETCASQSDYIQIIDKTDETQIQCIIQPCANAVQIVEFPDFSVIPLSDYWYSEGFTQTKFSTICKDAGVWALVEQNNVFVAGNIYQVAVTISELFGEVGVYNGSLLIGTIKNNGTSYFTFTAENPFIKIWITNSNYEVCIHSIEAREINQSFLVAIRNNDTDAIEESFTIASNPERFVFSKDTITISIPWQDYPNLSGCYYISVDDACTNTCGQLGILNASEDFIDNYPASAGLSQSGWELSGNGTIVITGGVARITASAGEVLTLTNKTFQVCAGKTYQVCHDISVTNGSIYYTLGDADSTTVSVTEVRCLANITPSVSGDFVIHLTAGAGAMTIDWNYITLSLVNSDYEFQYDSVPFKLGTFDCSLLVNISNNNDAFGFVFENSFFAPRIRIDGTLKNAKYSGERKVQTTADGRKQVYHGLQRKIKEFATEGQPEYVLDFLGLIPIADHLFISGTEYHSEDDEINITYPNGLQDFGQMILLVSEKQQTRENRNIGNPSNIIDATAGGYLSDVIQKYIIITEPSTGDTVEAL